MALLKMFGKSVQPTEETHVAVRLNKQQLEQIIDQVNADPLAGRGYLKKKEIVIDRILAHLQTVEIGPAPAAQPIMIDDSEAKA